MAQTKRNFRMSGESGVAQKPTSPVVAEGVSDVDRAGMTLPRELVMLWCEVPRVGFEPTLDGV